MEVMTNPLRKGSNPVFKTKRSKIQSERSLLNQQLNKQMRLRAGAENLYNATNNVKVKDTVALELSFLNSNLQLLKDELSVLNSHLTPYQNESAKTQSISMVSLGLKETKELDFTQVFKDFILEHYSEDPSNYEDQIADLIDLRNSVRTPARTEEGVSLLLEYYNQLHFVDYRFFPPNRQLGVHFHWYDSITGLPAMQKSLSLEKASIFFNIAALYSQMGTRADRCKKTGINEAIEAYERAAGAFNYVRLNFSHAPCTDLSHAFLAVMAKLMLAQAQETVYERRILGGFEIQLGKCISIAQEAAKVAEKYTLVHTAMSVAPVSETVPSSWSGMVNVKAFHYKALAHYYAATGLLQQLEVAEVDEISKMLSSLYIKSDVEDIPSPQDVAKRKEDRNRLGRAHLKQAIFYHEKASQIFKMCKALNKVETLQDYLSLAHKRSLEKKATYEDNEDDLFEIIDVPDILPLSQVETGPRPPNLASVNVTDIFKKLGPLSVFSARQKFTAPRPVKVTLSSDGWSFSMTGEAPVTVSSIKLSAKEAGLKEGDIIIKVEGEDVKWCTSAQVLDLLDKQVSKRRKDADEKLRKWITANDQQQDQNYSVNIQAVTLCGTENPQTAGRLSNTGSGDVHSESGFGDDAFYSSTGVSSPGSGNGKNKTFPVKRRYRPADGNKQKQNRHSMGFFQGLKMKLRTSNQTQNPYASTSSLDKIPSGNRRLLSMNFGTVMIPKATEKDLGSITRSETFTTPSKPQVTMFTKKMDIGLY